MPEETRKAVQTYVPASQRDLWADDAEALDMSLAEFVRSMVQAGRRDFDVDGVIGEGGFSRPNPGGERLQTAILDALSPEHPLTEAELPEALVESLEPIVNDHLAELMSQGEIDYQPGAGYVIDDGE